ncbi:hypothetical protein IRJ41_023865 [Triplophysa rosa]|uniref:Uncharacterized protein n=1 Tax=Triplophysa rosa TaxID=992332 RepID=A0A9W7WY28_TRIRA|nr:hypothetical protein IRJ41_023865 [Triplophysa rosa]
MCVCVHFVCTPTYSEENRRGRGRALCHPSLQEEPGQREPPCNGRSDQSADWKSGAERGSAGILGTERVVEPEGSAGDLAVRLGRPLTVGRDQDHQQMRSCLV